MRNTIIFIILLFLFCSTASSQNCKPFYDEEDEFTMEKATYYGYFYNFEYYSTLLNKVGAMSYLVARKDKSGNFFISFILRLPAAVKVDRPDWFKPGVKYMIKLEEDVLQFTSSKPEIALEVSKFGDALIRKRKNENRFTTIKLEAPITITQIEKIINQDIEKIRFYALAGSDDLSEDITPGSKMHIRKIKSQLACLLEGK
jgi:hypothetical protein